MSVDGFTVNGKVEKYDFGSLENVPDGIEVSSDDLGLEQDAATHMLYPTFRGVRSENGVYIEGGGGGGSGGNNAVLTVTNTSGWLSKTISEGAECSISASWTSLEGGLPTGGGVMSVTVDGTVKLTQNVEQGSVSANITKYLNSGTHKIKFRITDTYDNAKTINFTVNVIALNITSYFSTDGTFVANSPVTYTYTPYGATEKTVYFIVDGTRVGTATVTTSGMQQSYSLPEMAHGAHTLQVYFTAEVNGEQVRSNELYYELTVVDEASSDPIITSTFRITSAAKYETLQIPYTVYTPNRLNSSVKFYVNDEQLGTDLSVDRTPHVWSYRVEELGELKLTIASGTVTRNFIITVASSIIDAEAVTNDLVLYLTSYGRSNQETDPSVWRDEDNDISARLTNFNFVSDGWQHDADGITVLRVSGDARVYIPYKPFELDFRSSGKTLEFEFATHDVRDYDAILISCMNDGRGFSVTAQKAMLTSQASEIGTQYKEDDHVRISFVVEKINENRLIFVYINGIMSGVVQYPDGAGERFSQPSPVGITIGSNNCTIDIYNIRIYDNDLTRKQILDNWIADTQDGETMLRRYEHNNIYDEYGAVVIDKLPKDLPYMILNAAELPQYKGDKKTITGRYVDPADDANSFTFSGCQINVQGTSSAPYARKNYDMQFKQGFEMSDGTHSDAYALTDEIIPFNRFVLKADVASSEGANNVELVKLYCDANPFKRREQIANSKVRDGIYGFPIVVFWYDTENDKTSLLGKYNFNLPKRAPEPYGYSGDMESWEFQNNTSNLMLFLTDYFDETLYTDPTTGDRKELWRYDYEARFPSDEWVDYTKLQELQTFIYSTYRGEATGNALTSPVTYEGKTYTNDTADYRLAKFRAEFGNYAEVNSFLFYYIFTELFLMVDSRAKNLFIGFSGGDTDPSLGLKIDRKAVAEPYDMDTAIGTNNEGTLAFDYSLEDTDHLSGGANVFNGQDSVLWCNIRDAFPTEIVTMYQRLRSEGILSFANVEQRFEDHQAKWPEAIFNEDAIFKYIMPLTEPDPGKNPTTLYLPMLQGSKAEQRKWWLYNRFRYMDSKWTAGDASIDRIQMRGYAKSDISITPYADIYATVQYGSYFVQQRAHHGSTVLLECPMDSVSDTEIYIYSASQLTSIGDISGFKVGIIDVSSATKLQSLKIGDADPSYRNENLGSKELNALTVGNNTMLQKLDVRNCSSLRQLVDLTGCSSIEEVYFSGTSISGCKLPNGGALNTLMLPSTITSLEIKNQPLLKTFKVDNDDYSNIETLWIENAGVYVPYRDILETMKPNRQVRLINALVEVSTKEEAEAFMDVLDTMKGLDERGLELDKAVISGTMIVNDSVMQIWLDELQRRYPDLMIVPTDVASDVIAYLTNTLTRWQDRTATTVRAYAFYRKTALRSVKTIATTINSYAFSQCSGLTSLDLLSDAPVTLSENALNGSAVTELFVRSNSVSSLSNKNAFEATPIAAGNGGIYVPEELANEYRSATNWSTYAAQINPIEMYPVSDFSTINDSWETILTNPDYATDYAIGDTKAIDIDGRKIYMQIAAFDTDDLADGSGKAKITWLTKYITYTHRMNSTNTNAVSETDASQYNTGLEGWPSTEMRYWLRETIMAQFPEILRNNIKEVNKTYFVHSTFSDATYVDTIWVPSAREVGLSINGVSETSGCGTYALLNTNDKRKKYNQNGTLTSWVLRSAAYQNESGFYSVSTDGTINRHSSSEAATNIGVIFGFCT